MQKLTNSQKFTYKLYKSQESSILEYLRICASARDYQSAEHSKKHSLYTYTQKANILEIKSELEAKLISNRISLQKLQKINRHIKKLYANPEHSLENLDYLTQYFVVLYFKNFKRIVVKPVKPTSLDLKTHSQYKAIKRHYALKTLNPKIQARILKRRLLKLCMQLNPKTTIDEAAKFISAIMLDTARGGCLLKDCIAKAQQINPAYQY